MKQRFTYRHSRFFSSSIINNILKEHERTSLTSYSLESDDNSLFFSFSFLCEMTTRKKSHTKLCLSDELIDDRTDYT